jgi:hypothetical protein
MCPWQLASTRQAPVGCAAESSRYTRIPGHSRTVSIMLARRPRALVQLTGQHPMSAGWRPSASAQRGRVRCAGIAPAHRVTACHQRAAVDGPGVERAHAHPIRSWGAPYLKSDGPVWRMKITAWPCRASTLWPRGGAQRCAAATTAPNPDPCADRASALSAGPAPAHPRSANTTMVAQASRRLDPAFLPTKAQRFRAQTIAPA